MGIRTPYFDLLCNIMPSEMAVDFSQYLDKGRFPCDYADLIVEKRKLLASRLKQGNLPLNKKEFNRLAKSLRCGCDIESIYSNLSRHIFEKHNLKLNSHPKRISTADKLTEIICAYAMAYDMECRENIKSI